VDHKEDRKVETLLLNVRARFPFAAQDERECRWLTMTSHPQTDGIKPFVLCRDSRDMVCWVDPHIYTEVTALPDN
jgi:hypothetical protein